MKTNAIKITVVFCCKIILLFCCCFAELFGCWLHTQTVNDSLTRYWFFFELITLQLFVESAWIQEKEDTTSSRYPKSLWNTMSRQYVLMYPPLPNQYEIIRNKHHIELLPSNSIIIIKVAYLISNIWIYVKILTMFFRYAFTGRTRSRLTRFINFITFAGIMVFWVGSYD